MIKRLTGDEVYPCPACRAALANFDFAAHPVRVCPECHGCLIPLRKLSAYVQATHLAKILTMSEQTGRPGTRACPECPAKMIAGTVPNRVGKYELDVCRNCDVVWFDAGELAQAPTTPEVIDTTSAYLKAHSDTLGALFDRLTFRSPSALELILPDSVESSAAGLGLELSIFLSVVALLPDVPARKRTKLPGD